MTKEPTMKHPAKEAYKKAVKRFARASRCKPIDNKTVAGLVRFRGKPFHVAVSILDENFCVRVPSEKET